MDLRLRTVEDEKADRDAAAVIAAVAEFAPVASVAESTIAPVIPTAPGRTAVAEITAPGRTAVVDITAPVAGTASATAAENSADRSGIVSVSDLDVDFDSFILSRCSTPHSAVDTSKTSSRTLPKKSEICSPSLADSSSQRLDERFATFLESSTPPLGCSAFAEVWTGKTTLKFSTSPSRTSAVADPWTDITAFKFSTPPPRTSAVVDLWTDKTDVKFSSPPPEYSAFPEFRTDKTDVKFSTPPPRTSAVAEFLADKTTVKFSTPPPRNVAKPWTTFENAAGKSRSCSDLEVDFDHFVQSRASPLNTIQKSDTARPQSVPGKSKTRNLSPKPSFQPRSLFFPKPTENPSLRFPESSQPPSLCFPEPSRPQSLCFPEPSKTHSLCFPEPSKTRPLSFVESSKTSFQIFTDNFGKTAVSRQRSCSESEVDFDVFVQTRASPSRAPSESSKNRPLSVAEESNIRPLSLSDSSLTTSGHPDQSRTSPVNFAESFQTTMSVPDPAGTRSAVSSKTSPSCKTSPQGVSDPKTSKSRSPPVPESLRPRHASMEAQENSLKDLQHLKKQTKKKKTNVLLTALNQMHLHPTGSDSPKKANKGKYQPL